MNTLRHDKSLVDFESRATEAAGLMKALGNEKRLMILCMLMKHGEASVLPLADAVGLSQSALSQHLARMRGEGLVHFRRDGQTLFYRIGNPTVKRVIKLLQSVYC